jgi:type II secretion system protein N
MVRTFLYLLYACILTAVLLYIRFPTEKFKQYCQKRVEYVLTDSVCTIDRISYHFPLSLVASNLQITQIVDGTESNLLFSRLAIAPDLQNFAKVLQINGEFYQGNFTLKLHVDIPAKSFQLSDVQIKGFNLDEWASHYNLLERKVAGSVEFSGNYQARYDSPLDGIGTGNLIVAAGSMELLQPVLSLANLEFDKIFVDIKYEKELLQFIGGKVSGKDVSADFTGEMKTTIPLLNSNILLSGHLTPAEGFLKAHPEEKKLVEQLMRRYKMPALPFRVGGSIRTPTFRFSS